MKAEARTRAGRLLAGFMFVAAACWCASMEGQETETSAGVLPNPGNVFVIANDPFAIGSPGEGLKFDLNPAGVGKVIASLRSVKPAFEKQYAGYSLSGSLSPPLEIPEEVLKTGFVGKTRDEVRQEFAKEGCFGFTGGVIVTKAGGVYFCQVCGDTFTMTTENGNAWLWPGVVAKFPPGALMDYHVRGPGRPNNVMPAPAATDICAFSNYPAVHQIYKARYVAPREVIVQMLADGKRVDDNQAAGFLTNPRAAGLSPIYANFSDEARKHFSPVAGDAPFKPAEIKPGDMVEATGVFATRDGAVYFWELIGDRVLYLTRNGGDYCYIAVDKPPGQKANAKQPRAGDR